MDLESVKIKRWFIFLELYSMCKKIISSKSDPLFLSLVEKVLQNSVNKDNAKEYTLKSLAFVPNSNQNDLESAN